MTVALANPAETPLKKYLGYSLALHGALFVALVISAWLHIVGQEWSGTGGDLGNATKVNLIASAGIPIRQPEVTESSAVDPTKGLYKEQPKPPEPKTDATKIPKFDKEKPLPPSHPSKVFEPKPPPPDNAVRNGQGGNPSLPVGDSATPGASTGVSMLGQGGGDFATRYGWYIEATRRRILGNWDQLTIDSAGRASRSMHCAVTFTINRDGSLKNIQISEPSGNLSYDNSALRAVLSSSPLQPLPSDYSGSYVTGTIDFNPAGHR